MLHFILSFCACLGLWMSTGPFSLLAAPSEGASQKPAGTEQRLQAIDQLFRSSRVLEIKIEIPPAGIDTLRKYEWQFGTQSKTNRETVSATVREGDMTYSNVALHLKGAAGSFRSIDDKPAMTLNFDKFAKGQSFHGLQKLSLNNSVQDPTYANEQLCRELFLAAGVPVPQATHAQVELNGKNLGLYVLTEGWDRSFLKRHFKNARGNLYDGGFLQDIDAELETNAGDKKNQADRLALLEAARETNLTQRVSRLEKTLDIERFLTYAALEVMCWDWDGYPMNRNNWRLYHDTDQGKMVFLPHGLDQMFWKPEGSIFPPMQGIVAKALLEIPTFREQYFGRLKKLRQTVFDPAAMTNRVQEIARKVRPVIARQGTETMQEHEKAVVQLWEAIVARARSIDQQLETPIEPLKFDENGMARLAHWQPKTEFGHPSLQKRSRGDAGESLELGTIRGSSIGSFQTQVWLAPGRYRLAGKVKTEGIVADPGDPRAGAGFRTGQSRPQKYLTGTSDWKELSCEFTVKESLIEMKLLCDFRGAKGSAWFDLESLHLKRLDL